MTEPMSEEEIADLRAALRRRSEVFPGISPFAPLDGGRILATIDAKDAEIARLREERETLQGGAADLAKHVYELRERAADAAGDTAHALHQLAEMRERAERAEAEIERLRSNPADFRYWEGRYRDEAARAERAEKALAEAVRLLRALYSETASGMIYGSQVAAREFLAALDSRSTTAYNPAAPQEDT